jgi:hypothetical protein
MPLGSGGGGLPVSGGTLTGPLVIATPGANDTALTILQTAAQVANDNQQIDLQDNLGDHLASIGGAGDYTMEGQIAGAGTLWVLGVSRTFAVNDHTGTTKWSVFEVDGAQRIEAHAAPASTDLSAGQCALWFDQTNGASKLMVKAKSANGTVVTGSLALA